jgi:hypothetical protein
VSECSLAPEQVAPSLGLKLFYGAAQRRLRDMTFLSRPREIQRPGDGQKISDFMHFHEKGLLASLPYIIK